MKERSNVFYCQLACIAVDEAHLICGWREFCKELGNVGILRSIFPKVPIIAISVMMTPNTLEYVKKTLNLKTPVRLYQKLLDHPNITYIVALITSFGFEDLNFLIPPKIGGISNIEKTIIFVDNVEKDRALAIYLQIFLSDKLKDRDEDIIKSFSLILEAILKTDWLEKFLIGNIRIIR